MKNYRSRLHRNKIGSNQFRLKQDRVFGLKHKTAWNVALAINFILLVAIVGTRVKSLEAIHIESPLATTAYAMEDDQAPRVKATTPEQKDIVDYINQVFGQDADKALQLLSCENHRLNPSAVNTAGNFPAGSRDIGVFQINEYWQKTNAKYLFNWKINVLVAKQLFDENHGSFNLWTCGRKLGL